jgi:hypothetical protein
MADGLDRVLYRVKLRGQDATVFQIMPEGQIGIGITWTESGCDYTVFLDSSHDAASLAEYAARY